MIKKGKVGGLVSEDRGNGVTEILWNDQIAHRNRKPYLFFVKDGEAVAFKGSDIPGVATVINHEWTKAVKWSCTDWNIVLQPGVAFHSGHRGFDSDRICGRVESWVEVAQQYHCSINSIREVFQYFSPREAEEIDATEQKLAAVDDAAAKVETDLVVGTLSFGSPTNRAIREGFWDKPRPIPGGEIRKIDPSGGWCEDNLEIVGVEGKIISVDHVRGMHGGSYTIKYAIAPGTEYAYDERRTDAQKDAEVTGMHQDDAMPGLGVTLGDVLNG